jgi:hypothetical protein
MVQQILVALIVIAAALFALWRLPGTATRLRYAAGLKRVGLVALGTRLEARVLRSATLGGCKACSSTTQRLQHREPGARRPR